jgi:SsrA-binding protein
MKKQRSSHTTVDKPDTVKNITTNRKAFHDFHIDQKIEAGISLLGTEVKSVKSGNVNLRDGFAFIQEGEVFLRNVHIGQYPYGNRVNHEPTRQRKLLLHRSEIQKLHSRIKEKGYTLIPLRVYTRRGLIKIELGLAKGKRQYDKKEAIRERDVDRELRRKYRA